MKFEELQRIVGKEPVFETSLLMAGTVNPATVRSQLSRFVASGRLIQLRRGVYAFAPPFEKVRPHPFLIANRMVRASYVSLQSALYYYGLIPEHVQATTSVTTLRPWHWDNPLGSFDFRRIDGNLFFGYRFADLGNGQVAAVATPEKALLDLVYLESGADDPDYLDELRLEDLEILDLEQLKQMAVDTGKPKLMRAAERIARLAAAEAEEYETV